MKSFINNSDLRNFVSSLECEEELFAIRISKEIMVFNSEKDFNKIAKNYPDNVQGVFTVYNFMWYQF